MKQETTQEDLRIKEIIDSETYAVPLPYVRQALQLMAYASTERVMFQMLYYTGCRVSELDKMSPDLIHDNTIYWRPGKGQVGTRKEALPEPYIKELQEYRRTHRVAQNKLFAPKATTFRRYFDRDIRPNLGLAWNAKRRIVRSGRFGNEYALQLKGLRKTFQTMVFVAEWKRWGAADVALEFTSKRVKHSSKHMTAHHYLQGFQSIKIMQISVLEPGQALEQCIQKRMLDFDPNMNQEGKTGFPYLTTREELR